MNILIYVDGIVISGNDSGAVQLFKAYLHRCFHMKDLGKLKYFLGIEVARNPKGLFLCHRKYASDIIAESGLLGVKPAIVPRPQNHSLTVSDSAVMEELARYRRLVRCLLYLTITRPELTYSVHTLAQFMA